MAKIKVRELVVMNAEYGTVELYTLPQKVKTTEDLEDYIYLELEYPAQVEWMLMKKLRDFRNK